MSKFPEWPTSAIIYHQSVSADSDVTPSDARGIQRLKELPGPFYVVNYPADPISILVAVVGGILAVVAYVLATPKVPELKNDQAPSSNNQLADRQNGPRILGRIPDIYGKVRAIPDLLSAPYRVYINHKQLEISYLCIGRGAYEITDIRDGDTLVSNILGASLAVYGPGKSPNNLTDVPEIQIGATIGDPIFTVTRLNEVNGQDLKASNDRAISANRDLIFADGGVITAASGSIDFTDFFAVDDVIDIGGAGDDGGAASGDAILANAQANSGGFTFTGYNPTTNFAVGNIIEVTNAIYQFDDGGTSGDLSGGSTYSGYPVGGSGGRFSGSIP
jgi:hypothetical protein